MSERLHERPGVYSSYDASTVVSGGRAVRTIGVAAAAGSGQENQAVLLTSYSAGAAHFGEEGTMAKLLRLLFLNGASTVAAVRVQAEDYESAFAVLEKEDVQVVVCDSGELTVQQALRTHVTAASSARRERIGVVGSSGETVSQLAARAAALNSERMVLVGPDVLDSSGTRLSGVYAAAAVAGAIAAGKDPAVPLNGVELQGLGGVSAALSDTEIDTLVRAGVTPLESVAGTVSPIRGITTRTTTGEAPDTTWRELTTILIVDDVIPTIRDALRSRFTRTKNTARTRSAIRSQVIVELEKKVMAETIDSYGQVTAAPSEEDPSVCEVEFSFAVAHGLNQIYLTAHITV